MKIKILFLLILFSICIANETQIETQNQTQNETQNQTQNEKVDEPEQRTEFDDEFTREWERTMGDYESTYVYMIPVSYKSSQIYYENITTIPARLRGAYIVGESSEDRIEFKLKSPSGNIIYTNSSHSAIFNLNVTEVGLYEISFHNKFKNGELKPTFTMNTGQNVMLKKEDLSHTDQNLDQLITFLKNYGTEDKMKRNVHRKRYKKIIKTNKYFFTFSVIETIVLIAVSVWQFYYMRHLFEIKGSL